MTYKIVLRTTEIPIVVPRTRSLDKYTDGRIVRQYSDALYIYKMATETVCEEVLLGENWNV